MLNLRGKYYIDLGQKLYPLFRHSSLRVLQGVGVDENDMVYQYEPISSL